MTLFESFNPKLYSCDYPTQNGISKGIYWHEICSICNTAWGRHSHRGVCIETEPKVTGERTEIRNLEEQRLKDIELLKHKEWRDGLHT